MPRVGRFFPEATRGSGSPRCRNTCPRRRSLFRLAVASFRPSCTRPTEPVWASWPVTVSVLKSPWNPKVPRPGAVSTSVSVALRSRGEMSKFADSGPSNVSGCVPAVEWRRRSAERDGDQRGVVRLGGVGAADDCGDRAEPVAAEVLEIRPRRGERAADLPVHVDLAVATQFPLIELFAIVQFAADCSGTFVPGAMSRKTTPGVQLLVILVLDDGESCRSCSGTARPCGCCRCCCSGA